MPVRAFVVTKDGAELHAGVSELETDALGDGDVLIEVAWSAVNYKDAMVTVPGNRVARISPLVPGVDLAGTVQMSDDGRFAPGDQVIVQGYGLGVSHHGGFAEMARVPSSWVVPLSQGLTARQAVTIGTAGFTAVLSLTRLEAGGVRPGDGQVLVTGASGGVGSMTVAVLAHRGYEVVASTGKSDEHEYLRRLGAVQVAGRDELSPPDDRVLGPERWAGAVDCVGGETLANVLRTLRYGGVVAASGLTQAAALQTTVYPFIVRNVSLCGVDTVETPIDERRALWAEMASLVPLGTLEDVSAVEVGLSGIGHVLEDVLAARTRGRVLVRLGSDRRSGEP